MHLLPFFLVFPLALAVIARPSNVERSDVSSTGNFGSNGQDGESQDGGSNFADNGVSISVPGVTVENGVTISSPGVTVVDGVTIAVSGSIIANPPANTGAPASSPATTSAAIANMPTAGPGNGPSAAAAPASSAPPGSSSTEAPSSLSPSSGNGAAGLIDSTFAAGYNGILGVALFVTMML